jgi:glycine/D-amino acid oxidase-like deaminating enzyme
VKGKKIIPVDELKHITRIGMGPCRGKRCIPRVKQLLAGYGVEVVGDATPRGPLSSQLNIGELCPDPRPEKFVTTVNGTPTKKVQCDVFVAGGGITGSGLFRYFAEAGKKVVLCNAERGSSWRCIGGGRPGFSVPEIADIAVHNRAIFESIQKVTNINYKPTRYISFAHDEANYVALEKSLGWSNGYMVDKKDFVKEVSPYFNPNLNTYQAACITTECWQATPGPTINYIRNIAIEHGGVLLEDTRLVEVRKTDKGFMALVYNHDKEYVEYHCEHFVNSLGPQASKFASQLGLEIGLYPIKHQAFITHRLPMLGKDGDSLDMLIDRRKYKGFSAVYGQQFAETGQIIGCASPQFDSQQANKELKFNTKEFLQVCAEMFVDWIPQLKNVSFQATWAGYYTEPRYIVDPDHGLLVGMRGHGFMLGQYLAKIYVDKLLGREYPAYMSRLALSGDGLSENAFQ